MDFIHDIIIPFFVGLLGIYITYSIFDLLLEFSFGIITSIKDGLKEKKFKIGKIITLVITAIIALLVATVAVGNIFGDGSFFIHTLAKIIFGVIGFIVFVVFSNSPIHKRFNKNED